MPETRLDLPPYTLWETRAGTGTPVALVHGLSGSSRWWSKNIDALAERHLVAAIDLTGFGRTRRFLGPPVFLPPFSDVTSLLGRWLETFGEPVHLVGHSMGGQIAIRLTAERPDLVRSLTLVNAAGMPFKLDPLAHLRPLPKPPFGGPRIAKVLLPDFLRAGPASVAVASTRVILGDMREMMRVIRVPTLLVWGRNDPLVPLQYGREMQRLIHGSKLVVIERAAHVSMWDAPEEFNRTLLGFLEEIERTPSPAAPERAFSWGVSGWSAGVAHRQAGFRRDIVLVHGLGMSSAYFERFAHALFADGWHPVAPDLPGFGESINARPSGPDEHAKILAKWADSMGIREAVWIGHSIGCNAVAHLATMRPDLVRQAIHIGPLWSRFRFPQLRIFTQLVLDAFREPLVLYRYVFRAYWRTGVARWLMTWRRFARDIASAPPPAATMIAGERDPIPDRNRISLQSVPGAHACVVSHPEAVAEVVRGLLRR